jgi:hypothetical protein
MRGEAQFAINDARIMRLRKFARYSKANPVMLAGLNENSASG